MLCLLRGVLRPFHDCVSVWDKCDRGSFVSIPVPIVFRIVRTFIRRLRDFVKHSDFHARRDRCRRLIYEESITAVHHHGFKLILSIAVLSRTSTTGVLRFHPCAHRVSNRLNFEKRLRDFVRHSDFHARRASWSLYWGASWSHWGASWSHWGASWSHSIAEFCHFVPWANTLCFLGQTEAGNRICETKGKLGASPPQWLKATLRLVRLHWGENLIPAMRGIDGCLNNRASFSEFSKN